MTTSTTRGWPLPRWAALASLPTLARRHWLLTALLSAGLVLRVLTQIAYRPALIYIDSVKYLYGYGNSDPVGYRVLLEPLLLVGNLDLVAALQHLLGLAMAITLYTVLLRRGAPRWLAALATAPLLLDAYQLQIEQTIMPDVMFETLIVAGLAALLWRPRPTTALLITGGLALGASATARQVGEIFLLPALAYTVAATTTWRHRARNTALLTAAFAIPIATYCTIALGVTGHFRLAYTGANELYGRLASAIDCQRVAMPSYERPLCPSREEAAKLGIDGLEHYPFSPLRTYTPPPDMAFSQVVSDFNHRLLAHDPVTAGASVLRAGMTLFAVDRATSPGDTPISRWQFQDHYPTYPYTLYLHPVTWAEVVKAGHRFGGGDPVAVRPLASFLRSYQLGGGYTPGPLFAFAALAGLAGSAAAVAGRLRPRRGRTSPAPGQATLTAAAGPALACLLFFTAAVAILLASDAFEFSWRYQLPALVTLPPAAALAVTALLSRRGRATVPAAAASGGGSLAPAGDQVSPDLLVPGQRQGDDGGQGQHDHAGQQRGGEPHGDGPGSPARHDGQQSADAAAQPVRLGAGHQAGQHAGQGAGQVRA
jgi:hypothetical protein